VKKSLVFFRFGRLLPCLAMVALVMPTVPGCRSTAKTSAPSTAASIQPFAEATIILEHNASDGDGEIVMFVKGGDIGLAELSVSAPNGEVVLHVASPDKGVGYREFALETAEPALEQVLQAYPEGTYRFDGRDLRGARLHGEAVLAHHLPASPVIDITRVETGTVSWKSVPEAKLYRLEFEREDGDRDLLKFVLDLPNTFTTFRIPSAFLAPGDCQIGVAAVSGNGNVVVVEKEFTIRP
jgi:hypothetical protein